MENTPLNPAPDEAARPANQPAAEPATQSAAPAEAAPAGAQSEAGAQAAQPAASTQPPAGSNAVYQAPQTPQAPQAPLAAQPPQAPQHFRATQHQPAQSQAQTQSTLQQAAAQQPTPQHAQPQHAQPHPQQPQAQRPHPQRPAYQAQQQTTAPHAAPQQPVYAAQPAYVATQQRTVATPLPQYTGVKNDDGSKQNKSKNGKFLAAGLALGVLVGGVSGGAVAASIAGGGGSAIAQAGGTITVKNAETATEVSAVAAAKTQSVVTLQVVGRNVAGSGSGVIYSEDGYIITNYHVITLGSNEENPTIRARLSDGRLLDAKLVGADPYADLAVIKVDEKNLPAIELADSDKLQVGDLTIAIGAPLNLPSTVTSGVISAVNRGISVGSAGGEETPDNSQDNNSQTPRFQFPWEYDTPQQQQQTQQTSNEVTLPVVQTDASINQGNSGGALLNGKGELIGINVAIASVGQSEETAGSVGLGFAIPANLVKRVVDSIIAGETPTHGLLGASVADAANSESATHAGGLISEVQDGSAAAAAGLKAGDVITAVDGVAAADGTSVSALIRMHEGGSKIKITYSRGGEEKTTEVTLGTLGS